MLVEVVLKVQFFCLFQVLLGKVGEDSWDMCNIHLVLLLFAIFNVLYK